MNDNNCAQLLIFNMMSHILLQSIEHTFTQYSSIIPTTTHNYLVSGRIEKYNSVNHIITQVTRII